MNILTLVKILVTLGQFMHYPDRSRCISHNPFSDVKWPREGRVKRQAYAHLIKSVNQAAAYRLENIIFEVRGHIMVSKG
jgi:hypothetical protein